MSNTMEYKGYVGSIEFAPITELSPIVTPLFTLTFEPIHTFFPITIGAFAAHIGERSIEP